MDDRVEARIVRRASQSHRILTREELLEAGLGAGAIKYRRRKGTLHAEYPGVYAVGTPAMSAWERSMAAVKACGKGSLLADEGALAHWGWKPWPWQLAVLTPNDRRPKGLIVHRSQTLTNRDRAVHLGIPVTSPARTILDAATYLPGRVLTRTVNDALHTSHLTRAKLKQICGLHPTHAGARLILPFYDTTDGPTRADWEDTFPVWCVKHDIPKPILAYRIGPFTVDAIFLAERLIIELDGWESHSGHDSFEDDRDRDADNMLVGYPTVRITWYRLKDKSDREANRLQGILARRRIEVAAFDAYVSQTAA